MRELLCWLSFRMVSLSLSLSLINKCSGKHGLVGMEQGTAGLHGVAIDTASLNILPGSPQKCGGVLLENSGTVWRRKGRSGQTSGITKEIYGTPCSGTLSPPIVTSSSCDITASSLMLHVNKRSGIYLWNNFLCDLTVPCLASPTQLLSGLKLR